MNEIQPTTTLLDSNNEKKTWTAPQLTSVNIANVTKAIAGSGNDGSASAHAGS